MHKTVPKRIDTQSRSAQNTQTGIVSSLYPNGCSVWSAGRTVLCRFPGRKKEGGVLDPVPGDKVRFTAHPGGTCMLVEILPRRNVFARLDTRPPHAPRPIAANLDLVVIVAAVEDPPPRPRLLDRCLAAAWREGITPAVCLNKIDLPSSAAHLAARREIETYTDLGVAVLACSARTGEGLDELRRLLQGKTAAFVGHSGVGKSSLLNALFPGLDLAAAPVRAAGGKGRHTTTAAYLAAMDDGTMIFDTPGFREFGVEASADELRRAFPDFHGYSAECRYRDCTHVHEEECGVRRAVAEGRIPAGRYRGYLRLLGFSADAGPAGSPATFKCANCGAEVSTEPAGTRHRNHCPYCLYSKHLDERPGDRAAACGGLMEPIAVWVRAGGEWAVIHRCKSCGVLRSNRIASDDNEMLLLQLAVKPLAMPAFPLSRLGREEGD